MVCAGAAGLFKRILQGQPGQRTPDRAGSAQPFEYFAPSYVAVCEKKGELVRTQHPLLYNYVFVHASEAEIYRLKRFLPQYSFLPRVRDGRGGYYPYLSDEEMANLKWVAELR